MYILDAEILLVGDNGPPMAEWRERLQRLQLTTRAVWDERDFRPRKIPSLAILLADKELPLARAKLFRRAKVPFVLAFERFDKGVFQHSRELEPVGYLYSSFADGPLLATLQAALDNSRSQQLLDQCLNRAQERSTLLSEIETLAQLGHWEWDIETDEVRLSDESACILGTPGRTVDRLESALGLVAPGERPQVRSVLERMVDTADVQKLECHFTRPDGAVRLAEVRGKALRDSEGNCRLAIGTLNDVTERSKLQERLREHTELLETILENIPVMVTYYDRQGRVHLVNKATEALLGWSRNEAMNMDFLAAVLPDPEYRRQVWSFMQSAHGWGDVELTTRTGEVIETAWTNVRLADGAQIGIGINITERKQRERELRSLNKRLENALGELRQREREFEDLAENSPDIIARVDQEFRHIYVNRAIERVSGRKAEEFIGKTNRELGMPREHVAAWDSNLKSVFQTGEQKKLDFSFPSPQGKTYTYEWYLVPEYGPDNTVQTVLSIARDISDHIELERALRDSERRFRELAEQIDEVFWLTEWPENRVIYVSPAFTRVWGRPETELYEDSMTWVRAIVEEERHTVEQAFLKTAGKGRYDITFRIRRPDGEVRWIRDRGFGVKNEQGEIYRIAGVALDITELKRAQRDLQQTIQELAKAKTEAEQMNVQLSRMNKMLEDLTLQDPLTGVANRRFLKQFIDREWRRECRHNHEVALVIADVDQFKAYNDQYGHAKGDECLRQVAEGLATQIHRPTDVLVRFGGEEFVVVLLETELKGAARLAELMRTSVEALCLPHRGSSISDVVTISLGVATANPHHARFSDLLARADAALYKAKSGGRNRVQVYSNEGE